MLLKLILFESQIDSQSSGLFKYLTIDKSLVLSGYSITFQIKKTKKKLSFYMRNTYITALGRRNVFSKYFLLKRDNKILNMLKQL